MTVLIRASAILHVSTCLLVLLLSLRCAPLSHGAKARHVMLWLGAAALPVLAGRLYDLKRFGHIFVTGQSRWISGLGSDPLFRHLPPLPAHFPFQHPFYEGVIGVLFSPAKSIFIYDPLLLPCMAAGALLWKRLTPPVRWITSAALLDLLLHLALTGKLDFWHGDWSWGARYHLTPVHLLELAILPAMLYRAITLRGPAARLIIVLIVGALAVQLLAVAMPVEVEIAGEQLTSPVACDPSDWNSKLGFRLGRRIRNLSCLENGGGDIDCPQQIARSAQKQYPQCAAVAAVLRNVDHLAFFPFNPEHNPASKHLELVVWLSFLAMAVAGALTCGIKVSNSLRLSAAAIKGDVAAT